MNKNKLNYLVYVLIFCIVLVGVGAFYLGMHFSKEEVSKVNYKQETPKNASDLSIIKEELNSLIDTLNDNNQSGACFTLQILGAIPRYVNEKNYNLLNDLAGPLMECKYNGNYENKSGILSDYKVMSEKEYQKFREYFNITLKKDSSGYIAIEENDSIDYNPCIYEMGDIIEEDNGYVAKIKIKEENKIITEGKIIAKINNNHIFYDSIIINE